MLNYTFVIGLFDNIIIIPDGTNIEKARIEKIMVTLFSIDDGLDVEIGGLKPVAPD